MSNPVFIMLGSNIDPEANIAEALRLLAERLAIVDISPVYETPPVDSEGRVMTGQPGFLNLAVLVETDMPPARLKHDVLRAIEARLGRIRTEDKYTPRTIDLDIALYGHEIIIDPANGLVIPGPDSLTRPHVALPLADLAPDFVHPTAGRTLVEVAGSFGPRPDIRRRGAGLAEVTQSPA